MSADFNGLVVRNTFLEAPADDGGVDEQARERPRAVSDLTGVKMPWQDDGYGQVARRRGASGAGDTGEEALHTVEEEDPNMYGRSRKGSRASRTGPGNRRSRVDTAEFIPGTMGGIPLHGGYYPPMPMGPGCGGPMVPPGYPSWGYPGPGLMPPPPPLWGGRWPEQSMVSQGQYGGWPPYPGLGPSMPGLPGMPHQGGSAPTQKSGKGGGKQRREGGGAGEKGGAKKGANKVQNIEGQAKAAAAPAVPTHAPEDFTTVMLRNIPNRYTSGSLLALLDEHNFQSLYDFVYLPMDFQNGVNLGYAFVNLVTNQEALRFKDVFQGFQGWRFDSAKVSEVSWAHPHQGLSEHVERYRNSPVMHPSMPDEYKPMIFQRGARITFPPPTKVIKAPKLRIGRDRPRDQGAEPAAGAAAAGPGGALVAEAAVAT